MEAEYGDTRAMPLNLYCRNTPAQTCILVQPMQYAHEIIMRAPISLGLSVDKVNTWPVKNFTLDEKRITEVLKFVCTVR